MIYDNSYNDLLKDSRVLREAESLAKAGHNVSIFLIFHYNDLTRVVEKIGTQDITILGVAEKSPQCPKNIGLIRKIVWSFVTSSMFKAGFKAIQKLLSLAGFGKIIHFQIDNAIKTLLTIPTDVYHAHDAPTLDFGLFCAWFNKKPLVFDAHEIFGYMIRGNISKVVVNQAFKMEKKLIKYVDHVITVNEPLKNYFKKITNAPITIVMNCKDPISDHYEPPKNRVFTVSFISNLHRSRLLPEIIDVLGNIDNIRFVLAGKRENNKLYNEVEETSAKYDNVEFLGQIPFDQVIPRTFEANIVVNPGDPSMPQADIAIPNKLLESMACGRPIICNKGTYAEELTEKLNCGLVVDYDLNAIKEAVIKLRDNPELCEQLGKNGLQNAIKEFNWEKQKEKLLKIYEELKQKY